MHIWFFLQVMFNRRAIQYNDWLSIVGLFLLIILSFSLAKIEKMERRTPRFAWRLCLLLMAALLVSRTCCKHCRELIDTKMYLVSLVRSAGPSHISFDHDYLKHRNRWQWWIYRQPFGVIS